MKNRMWKPLTEKQGFRPQQDGASGGSGAEIAGQAQEEQGEEATSIVTEVAGSPTANAAINDEMAEARPETASSSATAPVPAPAPASTSSTVIMVEQSSSLLTLGDAPSTSTAAVPIISSSSDSTGTVSNNDISSSSSSSSISVQQPSSTLTPFITSTTTTFMTMTITPSPAQPAAEATDSASLDLAPLSTSPPTTMSSSAKAGMGIGVTFGLLSIASVTGLYLWRRRKNQRYNRSSPGGGGSGDGLGGFFSFTRRFTRENEKKDDAEWEIASAEKVEIVRGASARTLSRSDSSRSGRPSRDGYDVFLGRDIEGEEAKGAAAGDKGIALQILKVGMKVPARVERPNPALTSNPPSFLGPRTMPTSPSMFPSPPSSRGTLGSEKKTSSWPLPE